VVVFLVHAVWVGGMLLAYVRAIRGVDFSWDEVLGLFQILGPAPLVAGAFAYGLYRVRAFHPVMRLEYRTWLGQTPWNYTRPLPDGPVHLIWQDVILLGLAVAAALPFHGAASLDILRAFGFIYLAILLGTLLMTYEWAAAYGVALGLGGLVVAWPVAWQFFGVAAATYAVGFVGLTRSYRRFPWSFDYSEWVGKAWQSTSSNQGLPRADSGWPFELLGPSGGKLALPLSHGVTLALLAGWWCFAIIERGREFREAKFGTVAEGSIAPAVIVGFFMAGARLAIYRCFEYLPPISLAGRIASGRWVQPGYDQLFVAPVLALLAVILLPPALQEIGIGWVAADAIGVTFAALAVLTLPPGRQRWLLTGSHRVVPAPFGAKPPQMV
jgi:hypothetical protein